MDTLQVNGGHSHLGRQLSCSFVERFSGPHSNLIYLPNTQSKAHLATLLREIGEEAQAKELFDAVMESMTERLESNDGAILNQRFE